VESVELALGVLDFEMDRFLDHALWLTVDQLTPHWLPAVQEGEVRIGEAPKKWLYALEVVDNSSIVEPLLNLLSDADPDSGLRSRVLQGIAKFGNSDHTRKILDLVLDSEDDSGSRSDLLANLLEAGKTRGIQPSGDLSPVVGLLDSDDAKLRNLALRAVGIWKIESAREPVTALARDGHPAAIQALSALGGPESHSALLDLAESTEDPETRLRAVIGLSEIDLDHSARQAAVVLADLSASVDPTPLFNAFLQKKSGSAALAKGLADRKIPVDIAKLGVRLIGGSGRSEPELLAALHTAGGLTQVRTEISADEMTEILAAVQVDGDPVRGEILYRSANLNCTTCHAIAGSGGKVGPDLSTIGASAQDDYLVEALLLPNAKIKEGYHSKTVYTEDDEVFTGVPIRDTDSELALRDQFDEEIVIPKGSIESVEEGMSLMPGGLTDLLTRSELADLVRFLSALGEEGPYALDTRRWVRTWETLLDSPVARENLRVTGMEPVVHNEEFSWARVLSEVSGSLPLADLPSFNIYGSYSGSGKTGFVRFQLETTTPGKVELRFHGVKPVAGWVGKEGFEMSESPVIELAEGIQTITLAIPLGQAEDSISCEVVETDSEGAITKPAL